MWIYVTSLADVHHSGLACMSIADAMTIAFMIKLFKLRKTKNHSKHIIVTDHKKIQPHKPLQLLLIRAAAWMN